MAAFLAVASEDDIRNVEEPEPIGESPGVRTLGASAWGFPRPALSNVKRGRAPLAILCATALVVSALAFSSIRSTVANYADEADPLNLQALFATLNVDPAYLGLKYSNYSFPGMPKDVIRKLFRIKKTEKSVTKKADHAMQLKTASCVVDATQGAYFLERAALAITAATASCVPPKAGRQKSKHIQAACAADITGVLAAFSFVAEYISQAVLLCSQTVNMQAKCSAGIAGIVANTARIATQASFMAANCKNGGVAYDTPIGDSVWQMTRRLSTYNMHNTRGWLNSVTKPSGPTSAIGSQPSGPTSALGSQPSGPSSVLGSNYGSSFEGDNNVIKPTYDERGMEIASCALDVTQTATYLAMFGIAIDASLGTCAKIKPASMRSGFYKAQCAVSIVNVLESIFMASSFIASAVSHCSPATDQQALCASGAVGLIGGISGELKNSLDIIGSCKALAGHHRTTTVVTHHSSRGGRGKPAPGPERSKTNRGPQRSEKKRGIFAPRSNRRPKKKNFFR